MFCLLYSKHIKKEVQWGRRARNLTKKMMEKLFAGINLKQLNHIIHDRRNCTFYRLSKPHQRKMLTRDSQLLRFFLYLGSEAKHY